MSGKSLTFFVIGIVVLALAVGVFYYFTFLPEEGSSQKELGQDTGGSKTGPGLVCIEDWSCGEWSDCIDSEQLRTCTDLNDCGTLEDKPVETQSCVNEIEPCMENWDCGGWSPCQDGVQLRTCTDLNDCGTSIDKPLDSQTCDFEVEVCGDGVCVGSYKENFLNCWQDCKPEFDLNNFKIYGERDSAGAITFDGTKSCSGTYQPECCSGTETEYKDYNAYYTCDYVGEGVCGSTEINYCRQKCTDFGLEFENQDVTAASYKLDLDTGDAADSIGFFQCSCKVC